MKKKSGIIGAAIGLVLLLAAYMLVPLGMFLADFRHAVENKDAARLNSYLAPTDAYTNGKGWFWWDGDENHEPYLLYNEGYGYEYLGVKGWALEDGLRLRLHTQARVTMSEDNGGMLFYWIVLEKTPLSWRIVKFQIDI